MSRPTIDEPEHRPLAEAATALAAANEQVRSLLDAQRRMAVTLAAVVGSAPYALAVAGPDGSIRACSEPARALGAKPGGALADLGPELAAAAEELLAQAPPEPGVPSTTSVPGWTLARVDVDAGDPPLLVLWDGR